MDNIIAILIDLLKNEHTDEQLLSWIRDHQEELANLLQSEHRKAGSPSELALCSFEDLFNEMKARTKSVLVSAEFDRKSTTCQRVMYGGSIISAMGLLVWADRELSTVDVEDAEGDDAPFDTDNSMATEDEDEEE